MLPVFQRSPFGPFQVSSLILRLDFETLFEDVVAEAPIELPWAPKLLEARGKRQGAPAHLGYLMCPLKVELPV